jgi:tellurite resistance protein TerC
LIFIQELEFNDQKCLHCRDNYRLLYFWILFNLFALGMLVLDLKVFHRAGHVVRFREALGWSAMYVVLALLFAGGLYFWQGPQSSLEFLTGYVLELSLSVDNLFVFLVIFRYFSVPEPQQHRVLFWGIIGALVMRGIFIVAGVGLIHRFHWILYAFGALLVYSGIQLALSGGHSVNPAKNPVVRLVRRVLPVTQNYHNGKFFVRENSVRSATPLLIVLLVIETSDVLFAVDSIPAILAITLNAFIVYTSNVFAILGLRSLYFAISGLMKIFRFLHYGLALVLVLVGTKMLLSNFFRVPIHITLAAIAGVLLIAVALSMLFPQSPEKSNT